MKITILCSSATHPVNRHINAWMARHGSDHLIHLARERSQLSGGDVLFLISCGEIIRQRERDLYRHTFVLHASDLPKGRGWNPHIWAVLEGATEITVSILEAEDKVDTGAIWGKLKVPVPKHCLWDEINEAVFDAEFALMDRVLEGLDVLVPSPQASDVIPNYYRLRRPEDSRLDPLQSIAQQFDLIRVCDPDRYPAFFDLHGERFVLTIQRIPPLEESSNQH